MGFLTSIWNGIKSLFSGSFLGSTVGAVSSSVTARKEREWNADQAEINRTFQSNQAALQRDWSAAEAERARDWEEEMYSKYNSLSGKVQQAHDAGVNPMLAITGNAVSPMSTSSPMPSGASAGAVGNPTGSFVNIIGEMLGLQKLQAETSLIKEQAKGVAKDTSWKDMLNQAQLDFLSMSTDEVASRVGVNFETANKLKQETQKLILECSRLNKITDSEVRKSEADAKISEYNSAVADIVQGDGDTSDYLSMVAQMISRLLDLVAFQTNGRILLQ